MSDSATATAPVVGTSDVLNAPAPAAPAAPKFQPVGFPQAPAAFHEPAAVEARKQIEARKSDREFGKRLLANEPAASAEWTGLHKTGFPAVTQITSAEDVNSQAAAMSAEH